MNRVKKMKGFYRASLLLIALVLLLVACTASAVNAENISPTVTETYISTSGFAYNPAIYGDKIVWQDDRNGYEDSDIYMYDLSTKTETQITNTEQTEENPAIYGDRIVYSSYGDPEICIYNISTKNETQINISGYAENPVIYGNRIVYSSARNGNTDIYMYDLSTSKETQITSSPDTQTYPAFYGNRIVWVDAGGEDDGWENQGIFMYDISTNKKMRISSSGHTFNPAIYGNKIVWGHVIDWGADNIYMGTI